MFKKICVFGYDFPHAKTQNGLIKLCANGLRPELVILQERKSLKPNADSIGMMPKNAQSLIEPRDLCKILNIPYVVADHDGPIALGLIKTQALEFGVILGARILKKETIESLPAGILNMHCGDIVAGNNGLDNVKKAILFDLDPVVTFHLIDHRIDAGKIIFQERVPIYQNDSIHSISLRHGTVELDGMIHAIKRLQDGTIGLAIVGSRERPVCLGDEFDCEILGKFEQWKTKKTKAILNMENGKLNLGLAGEA